MNDDFRRILRAVSFTVIPVAVLGCARFESNVATDRNGTTRIMTDWNRAIRRASALWKGGDCAASVPLDSKRTLWLFGDSWIAPCSARGRKGGRMIRNSIALQHYARNGQPRFDFYWSAPAEQQSGARNTPFFLGPAPGTGLWPLNGIRVGDFLCLFLVDVVDADTDLGFDITGNRLLLVRNPDDSPPNWRIEQHPIPFFRSSQNGRRVFGSAAVLVSEIGGEFLYILGHREDWSRGFSGRDAILARVTPRGALEANFSSWEFYDGTGWSNCPDHAKPLFPGAAAEMSLHYDSSWRRYIVVYTRYGLSRDIVARLAPHPSGPWSEPVLLYRCPEGRFRKRYFCYAGKAHPELSRTARTLVVTYAVNSTRFDDHLRDSDLYWPRFVVIRLPDSTVLDGRHNRRR